MYIYIFYLFFDVFSLQMYKIWIWYRIIIICMHVFEDVLFLLNNINFLSHINLIFIFNYYNLLHHSLVWVNDNQQGHSIWVSIWKYDNYTLRNVFSKIPYMISCCSSASIDNFNKTLFYAITESKYWEIANEIVSFFKLSTEALNHA